MVRADVCTLISENPKAHGIFDDPQETGRKVFCTVRSVTQSEVYQAQAVGLAPELKLVLSHAFEYADEKMADFCGHRYVILRTYVNQGDEIELTVQRLAGNAAEVSANGQTAADLRARAEELRALAAQLEARAGTLEG